MAERLTLARVTIRWPSRSAPHPTPRPESCIAPPNLRAAPLHELQADVFAALIDTLPEKNA